MRNKGKLTKVNGLELLEALTQKYGIYGDYINNLLLSSWEEIVGKEIAKNTKVMYLSKNMLYVNVKNNIWLMELQSRSRYLILKINKFAKKIIVKRINFKVGSL